MVSPAAVRAAACDGPATGGSAPLRSFDTTIAVATLGHLRGVHPHRMSSATANALEAILTQLDKTAKDKGYVTPDDVADVLRDRINT